MAATDKTIGQRLTELRGERTMEEVAAALAISRSSLSMYENDKRIPRDEIKIRIADYYKVTVDSLFLKNYHET